MEPHTPDQPAPSTPTPPKAPEAVKPASVPFEPVAPSAPVGGAPTPLGAAPSIVQPAEQALGTSPAPSVPVASVAPPSSMAPSSADGAQHMTMPKKSAGISWLIAGAALALGLLSGLAIGYFVLDRKSDLDTAYSQYLDQVYGDDQEAKDEEYAAPVKNITPAPEDDTFEDAQAKARDTHRRTDINNMHAKLEEYYNENNFYPDSFTTADLPGIDQLALKDPDGNLIAQLAVAGVEASGSPYGESKPSAAQYTYTPYDCADGLCQKYAIHSWLEVPRDNEFSYTKKSLN